MKKYDLICSLGSSCLSCGQLRARNLQIKAFPFDWLWVDNVDNHLKSLINIFKNESYFKFTKETLHKYTKVRNAPNFINKDTNFIHLHDFPEDFNFNEDKLNFIQEKYTRRFKRLYSHLRKSKNVAFLFESIEEGTINVDLLKQFSETLKNKYPKVSITIKLFIFQNKSHPKIDIDNVEIYFIDSHKRDINIDDASEFFDNALNNCSLSIKGKYLLQDGRKVIKERAKRLALHIIACFVPSKKIRRKIRSLKK